MANKKLFFRCIDLEVYSKKMSCKHFFGIYTWLVVTYGVTRSVHLHARTEDPALWLDERGNWIFYDKSSKRNNVTTDINTEKQTEFSLDEILGESQPVLFTLQKPAFHSFILLKFYIFKNFLLFFRKMLRNLTKFEPEFSWERITVKTRWSANSSNQELDGM